MTLLERARAGDRIAQDLLLARYRPVLERWAHGRLPAGCRDLNETPDLVQMTLIRAYRNLDHFVPRHEGAFLAYLRQILHNQVRDEIRRFRRLPTKIEIPEDLPDDGPLPLEETIGREAVKRYEAALKKLPEDYREAIFLRVEMRLPYEQVAEAMQRPTANAARLLVRRAVLKLSEEMDERAG
ncbi:MAG: RNA polymerase sigma factor [Candidatus Eiseniibacteriota bacterium]